MTTLKNEKNLAVIAKDSPEKLSRNTQMQKSTVLRVNEEYINQVSDEKEGWVTKKLSHEFRKTESHILRALSKLDGFFPNTQVRVRSGTVPVTSRIKHVENQEPIGYRS